MYTFYNSNILYIFISCGEYARRYTTTHWTESSVNVDWSMVNACVGLKMV